MHLIEIVEQLEQKSNQRRFEIITEYLRRWEIPYFVQQYPSGKNIIVPSGKPRFIGISSHFDVVPRSGGANDNASAIAVCLSILKKRNETPLQNIGIQVFFFDEEETGLRGSQAYIERFGIKGLLGLFNLEMVGSGEYFALWPLNESSSGLLLETFENIARKKNIYTQRFDRIITNTADHLSFQQAMLREVFTITCISSQDLEVAKHYYKAQEFSVEWDTLYEIIAQAPLFKHYHQASDLSIHLHESSLQMTVDALWEAILSLDNMPADSA
jgi:Peptidase family M28